MSEIVDLAAVRAAGKTSTAVLQEHRGDPLETIVDALVAVSSGINALAGQVALLQRVQNAQGEAITRLANGVAALATALEAKENRHGQ